MIVADASAIVEWLVGGPRGQAVGRALKGADIHAPAHLDMEVAQVMVPAPATMAEVAPGVVLVLEVVPVAEMATETTATPAAIAASAATWELMQL